MTSGMPSFAGLACANAGQSRLNASVAIKSQGVIPRFVIEDSMIESPIITGSHPRQ
jgi:hypothetical protein